MITEEQEKIKRFRLPPTYFNLSWIAMLILNFTFPIYRFLYYPYNLTGLLLMLLGLWMNVWASGYFKRNETTVKPFQTPDRLITAGFYRYSRHPMYLGMLLTLLGIFLLLGSISPLIVLPVFIILITRRFIYPEEQVLLEQFGDAYKNYQRKVRRWI